MSTAADGDSDHMERDISLSDDNILSDVDMERLNCLKRPKNSDPEVEDGFTEVRRRPKKYLRTSNKEEGIEEVPPNQPTNEEVVLDSDCEIGITSTEPLPKQMALAKLLRSYEIKGIIRIKYKSTFRVQLTFDSKEKADTILNCEEIKKRGFRCLRTDEMDLRYGVVRQVDLEIKDEELRNMFESEKEIASVWRLKRQTIEGTWVESETVRLCFRGHTVPPYVEAYGCRFKVDPYIFPVSQCSGCWRYGHRVKFCPVKKIICPKCGSNHANCETIDFKCVNCKGPHMSLQKSKCPAYHREKEIRTIMRDESCTYKNGFEKYENYEKIKEKELPELNSTNKQITEGQSGVIGNYKKALLFGKTRREEDVVFAEDESSNDNNIGDNEQVTKRQRKKKNKKNKTTEMLIDQEMSCEESEKESESCKKKKSINFMRIFKKIVDIMSSEIRLDEKITKVLKIVFEECYPFIAEVFGVGDSVNKFLSIFING